MEITDQLNICLKCKYGKTSGKKIKNPDGIKITKCECCYSSTPGKGAGYRKSCKNFSEKIVTGA